MQEQGIVTKVVSEGRVEIALSATEACEHCGACHRKEDGQASIEAIGIAGLASGDQVEIEISTGGMVTASFIVYLLPVLFLIGGYGAGATLAGIIPLGAGAEAAGIVGAFACLVVSFGVVRWYDGKVRSKGALPARVTRVISRG